MIAATVSQPVRRRRKPISGPALVVLGLVLAGIWFGSRSLSESGSFSVEGGESKLASEPAPSPEPAVLEPPASSALASDQLAVVPPTAGAPSTTQLPDGYPASIPEPSDSTLTAATGAMANGQASYVASYSVRGESSAVSQRYRDQLTTAGFTVDDQAAFAGPSGETLIGATKRTVALTASFSADSQTDVTILTINAVVEQ